MYHICLHYHMRLVSANCHYPNNASAYYPSSLFVPILFKVICLSVMIESDILNAHCSTGKKRMPTEAYQLLLAHKVCYLENAGEAIFFCNCNLLAVFSFWALATSLLLPTGWIGPGYEPLRNTRHEPVYAFIVLQLKLEPSQTRFSKLGLNRFLIDNKYLIKYYYINKVY